jgi:hypothetical protein
MEGADGERAEIMSADKCQRKSGHALMQLIKPPDSPESIGGYQPTTGSGRGQRATPIARQVVAHCFLCARQPPVTNPRCTRHVAQSMLRRRKHPT